MGVEGRPLCGKSVHVGRVDKRMPVRGAKHRPMFVGHDDQDIWLAKGRHLLAAFYVNSVIFMATSSQAEFDSA